MILPPYLKAGDKVALVATARKVNGQELLPAIDLLHRWGLEPVLSPWLYAASNQFAGDDETRTKSLQWAIDDPGIKAIWCARGGYGTVRIVDRLNLDRLKSDPKWLIGYSDLTVMQSHFIRHYGLCSLHATMAFNVATNSSEALEGLRQVLHGKMPAYTFPGHALDIPGNAEGRLVGGNLSVLYSLLGSVSDIDTAGCILFLEDLDEYLYHIDRMMMALDRAGRLSRLKALVVGGMTDMRDNTIPFGNTAEEIIREKVEKYNYPLYFGLPAGHIADNRPLVMGADVSLSNGIMRFL